MTDQAHQELDRLLTENDEREQALHQRGACTDRLLPSLRADAFIDAVVESLGLETTFRLGIERRRAQAFVDINAQLDQQEQAQRQADLLGRPVTQFPVRGGDGR